jgi:hypothetical protein
MKKISAFVLASSLALASTAAFAGGTTDPVIEPTVDPVVTEGPTPSSMPLWAILAGVLVVGAVLTSSN